jgi:hypothetical protein
MWKGEGLRHWLVSIRGRFQRPADLRERERDAGQQPADRSAVLVVFVLSLAAAFLGGLLVGVLIHCQV